VTERITSLWPDRPRRSAAALPWLVALALSVLLMAALAALQWRESLNTYTRRLPAVAASRAGQIGMWVSQLRREAAYLQKSELLQREIAQLVTQPSAARQAAMRSELEIYARAEGYETLTLVDAQGHDLLSPQKGDGGAEARALIAKAASSSRLVLGALSPGTPNSSGGQMTAALRVGDASGAPLAWLVMRVSAVRGLSAIIGRWPLPSPTARMRLWDRQGDLVVSLHMSQDPAVPQPELLQASALSVARILRGEAAFDQAMWGNDEAGTAIYTAVAQVPGLPWVLSTQVERSELLEPVINGLPGILAMGISAFVATLLGATQLRQRRELHGLQRQRLETAERMRTLATLEGLARASRDAIFAKDLQGRYVLWNEASERVTGMPASQALGHTDAELFTPEIAARRSQEDAELLSQGIAQTADERLSTPDGRRHLSVTKGPLRDDLGHVVGVFGIARDITDIRNALEALRRSESSLKGIVEGTDALMVRADRQLRISFQNPAFEAAFGLKVGDSLLRGVEVAHSRMGARGLRRMLRPPAHQSLELRCRTLAGWRTLLWQSSVLAGADGRTAEVQGVGFDVTRRVDAEEALRLSQERLSLALQASVTGVWELDLASGNYRWSAEVWELVGRTPPAAGVDTPISGAEVVAGVVESDRERVQAELARAVAMRGTFRSEFRIRRDDGELRWVLDLGRLLCDEQGLPLRLIGTAQDITERKRAEHELEQHRHHLQQLVAERTRDLDEALRARQDSERFLRMVADILPSSVSYWSTERRCLFVNRSYAEQLGRPQHELAGRLDSELLSPSRLAYNEPLVQRVLAGEEVAIEYPERGPDGSLLSSYMARFLPDVRDGRIQGYLFLASDVTALRRAQDELEHANAALVLARNQAESAGHAKSAFLANMSHEIRTPLNAITGMAHLLQRDATEPLVSERAAKVSDAAHHLLSLINDVLDLSKIEAGKLTLEELDFSLESLVDRAHALVGDAARAKGLELVLHVPPEIDRLRGDPTRVLQTLVNLLGNAVKFTSQGCVALRVEALSSDPQGVLLKCSVRDTGIGISAQALGHLFTAFSQGDSSNTRRYGGTGLGLAISRRLAQMMGGDIGATSEPGVGSTFWFTCRLAWGRGGPALEPAAGLQGRRVLLVDDLEDARSTLAATLRALGLRVDAAATGGEALARAAALQAAGEHLDLALVDWRMPGMDAAALATRLREHDPALTLALTTAYDEPAMWRAARAGAYQQVLVKPLTRRSVHDALLRLLTPLAGAASPAGKAPLGPNAARLRRLHHGARVLVAEDNPINLEVLTALLESCALTVLPASDGHEAVALVHQAPLDLILMDLSMPGLDGLSAVRATRQLPEHTKTPILAVSANAFEDDRRAALAAGMNGHISKPIDSEELFGQLLRWLPDSTRHDLPVLGGEEQTVPAPLPPAPAPGSVAELRALLEAGDYAALDLWRQLEPAMVAHHGEPARQVGQAISQFAYGKALVQLEAALLEAAA
jgi:PAS domain S-box-containing protein